MCRSNSRTHCDCIKRFQTKVKKTAELRTEWIFLTQCFGSVENSRHTHEKKTRFEYEDKREFKMRSHNTVYLINTRTHTHKMQNTHLLIIEHRCIGILLFYTWFLWWSIRSSFHFQCLFPKKYLIRFYYNQFFWRCCCCYCLWLFHLLHSNLNISSVWFFF